MQTITRNRPIEGRFDHREDDPPPAVQTLHGALGGRAEFETRKALQDLASVLDTALPEAKIHDLANCRFLDTYTDILLVGSARVGKSHLAQAPGHRAAWPGTACSTRPLGRCSPRCVPPGLRRPTTAAWQDPPPCWFIVDDLCLRPLEHEEPMDLFDLIRARHARSATILTTNQDVAERFPSFGDPLLAQAARDCLLHQCEIVVLDDRSH